MMARPVQNVQRLTKSLIERFSILEPPVPVDQIASQLGIRLVYMPFSDNPRLSGMLVREEDTVKMGINSAQGKQRQRFTIAHELGHFFLDPAKNVWIDQGIGSAQISYRMTGESSGVHTVAEVRANKFAAALLMPAEWLAHDFSEAQRQNTEWDDEDVVIRRLAARYQVSQQAMIIRLLELGLLEMDSP